MKNWRFSTNISLYFETGKRYGHSVSALDLGLTLLSLGHAGRSICIFLPSYV